MNSTSTILGAGHTPNESIAYRVIIVAVVFSILSFALLCTRLYTKYFVVKKVDLSDCMSQWLPEKNSTKLFSPDLIIIGFVNYTLFDRSMVNSRLMNQSLRLLYTLLCK
jgi:hypothetical protein